MVTKPLKPIRSRRHLRARLKYAGDANAKSHLELSSIKATYHGPANSPAEMIALSRQLEKETVGKKQRPTEIVGYEIIISTPEEVYLTEEEEDEFFAVVTRTLKAVAYVIGRHRHKDGRTDFHLIPLNRSLSGGCLALSLVSPKTGRKNRNLTRVMRAAADVAHDMLNENRRKLGKPWITTMSEVISARMLKRQLTEEREAENPAPVTTVQDASKTEEDIPVGDLPPKPTTKCISCEELTAKVHQVGAGILSPTALEDWIDFSKGGRPKPELEAITKASCPSAVFELMNAIRALMQIFSEREEREREEREKREREQRSEL